MAIGKTTALATAIFGAIVFGAWIGPYLSDHAQASANREIVVSRPATTSVAPTTQSATHGLDGGAVRADANPATSSAIPSAPQLQKHLKPLLNKGADMDAMAAGFQNAEDFAATVHAAKNTKLPFLVLKHQVVDEGKTLAAAIHAVKPNADASLEADLARSEARSDITAIK